MKKIMLPVAALAAILTLSGTAGAATSPTSNPVTVYVTAKGTGQKLSKAATLNFSDAKPLDEKKQYIFIDPSKKFQALLGIGGALTDASAETFYKLPKASQEKFLKAYYDPTEGIGYSLARTNIHSCDFSSDMYNYVEPNDADLKTFSIAHDMKYRVPFIKEVLATAGRNFAIYASPWSPPAWMKTNNNMLHGGSLKPEYYDAWAKYCVKFIQAYEKEGIPVWGLTPQNEPLAKQKWESCIFSAAQERDFIKNNLGPALGRAGLGSKKIIIWDHNRDMMFEWASVIMGDPKAARYVWGMGYHWYSGEQYDNLKRVQEAYPKLNLMLTEGCEGPYKPEKVMDWKMAEHYGSSMIHDFNNGAVGWTDWNVLLDQRGGPNHVNNFCFAPVHGNTVTGKLTFANSYYYIGHFSKFVRPGARRISAASSSDDLLATAFQNKDGSIVVIVMNATIKTRPFNVVVKDKSVNVGCPAHSITTVVF